MPEQLVNLTYFLFPNSYSNKSVEAKEFAGNHDKKEYIDLL